MVKRLTGLAAGAHTIVVTITGSDSVANSCLILMGMGAETVNPTTPLVWCNIARTPGQTAGQKTNSLNLNTDSAAVIAGTFTPIHTNSAEPAFGSNVAFQDIDSLLNGASTTTFFLPDGLHPNARGHAELAAALFRTIRSRYTTEQLAAR
jgi:hypothetical protein